MQDTRKDTLVERYLAIWNETDATKRSSLINDTFTQDVTYTDPLVNASGRADLDRVIAAAQEQLGGLKLTLAGPVDMHHDIARFRWEVRPEGGEALVIGFDCIRCLDGRIQSVLGFLDKVPAAA